MSEEILPYEKLAGHFDEKNLTSDDRRVAVGAAYIALLLEQIKLRDERIKALEQENAF